MHASLAEGGSESPDATARPVTINFDTVATNIALPPNQYQIASFSSYTGGTVYTQNDGQFGGSYPNGIVATSGSGYTYWPTADVHVNFALPVNGLSFRILGSQAGGSSGDVDVYVNHAYYQSIHFFSGNSGGPGQIYPPFIVNLSAFQHVTGITIRNVANYDYWYFSNWLLYYDDFTFTPELVANIINPKVNGGLDQTTQNALLGADISLQASTSQSGGTYSWSFSGIAPAIVSGCQSSATCTIRLTNTGTMAAKLTYLLNGVSVAPTVNINSILPSLTSFTAQQGPDMISGPNACVPAQYEPPWWFYRLGCGSISPAINFTAQVHVPALISEASQSGIKYVQAISGLDKFRQRGTRCVTHRTTEADVDSGWQLDTSDPYVIPGYSFHRFDEGNDITALMVDAPKEPLTGISSWEFKDNTFIDDHR